jgi:hypothetical protein
VRFGYALLVHWWLLVQLWLRVHWWLAVHWWLLVQLWLRATMVPFDIRCHAGDAVLVKVQKVTLVLGSTCGVAGAGVTVGVRATDGCA